MLDLGALTREELETLVRVHARNWLAHDGCWFLAIEEKHGLQEAIALDTRAWERFTTIEAGRILQEFGIPAGGGLDALERALAYRLYATINDQDVVERSAGRFVFRMRDCRVQSARRRAGRPLFPCKPVGLVEYAGFARTVDPRIATRCVHCPPDEVTAEAYCAWEFTLRPDPEDRTGEAS